MENYQVMKSWTRKPIKDDEDIQKLLAVPGRDGLIIKLALYTGLRNTQIRTLLWEDVLVNSREVKKVIEIKSTKQSALQMRLVKSRIKLVEPLREAIMDYYDDLGKPPMSRYIFYPSRHLDLSRPMTVNGINYVLKKQALRLRLKSRPISMHTLRKTLITKYWRRNGLEKTMEMTGHTSVRTLFTYLGITQEEVEKGFVDFYGDEYKTLRDKIEAGEVDINIDTLISGISRRQWQETLFNELRKYHSDDQEIAEAVDWLLLPYKMKKR